MSEDFGSISIDRPDQPSRKKPANKRGRRKKNSPPSPPESNQMPGTQEPEKKHKPKKRRKSSRRSARKSLPLGKIAIGLLLLLVTVTASAIYSTPYLIKKYLPEYVKQNSQFEIDFAGVEFNPLNFHLIFHDLNVIATDGNNQADFMAIPKTTLKLLPLPLLKKQIITTSTHLENARVTIERGADGKTNTGTDFKKLLSSDNNPFNLANLPIAVSLNNIELTDGSFIYNDKQKNKVYRGEDICLRFPAIGNISHPLESYIDPYFSAKINGSHIELSGDQTNPDSKEIVCKIDNLNIPQYLSQIPLGTPIDIQQGIGNGLLTIAFNPETSTGDKIKLKFDLIIQNILLSHPEEIQLVSTEAVFKGSLNPFSNRLHIDELLLTNPNLQSKTNLSPQELISKVYYGKNEESSNNEQTVTADKILVKNGKATFISNNKPQEYTNLEVTLGSTQGLKTVNITGKVNSSSFKWDATIKENQAVGPLTVSKIDLQDLLPRHKGDKVQGSGELNGDFSISLDKSAGKVSLVLKEVKSTFKNIQLTSNNNNWLKAKQLTINDGLFSKTIKNFGDLVIIDAVIDLNTDKLPPIFSSFTAKEGIYKVKSINVNGNGIVRKEKVDPLDLSSFTIKADSLDNPSPTGDNISISAQFNNKPQTRLSGKGRTRLAGFSLWLSTIFFNVPSKELLPWFDNNELFTHSSTIIDGKGVFTLPTKSFKGELQTGETIFGTKKSKKIKWQKAAISGVEYIPGPSGLKIDKATIHSPSFNWTRKTGDYAPYLQMRHFFVEILSGGKIKQANKIPVQINNIAIKNGSIAINDLRTTPEINSRFSNINGTIKGLDTSGNRSATLKITGKLAGADIKLDSRFNFWGQGKPHEYSLEVNQLSANSNLLKQLKAGNPLELTASMVDVKIFEEKKGKQVNTINDFILTDAKSKNPTMNLVLSMFREDEKHTKFSFVNQKEHPVKDNSILAELKKYLDKLMIKAETSPFLLSRENFSDLAEKESVDFRFGEIALTGSGMETLIRLREFLTLHPYVNLRITGEASDMDEQALLEKLEAKELKRVEQLNNERYREWEAAKQKRLEEQGTTLDDDPFTEEDIFVPLQPETVSVDPESLVELANNRALLIGQVFTKQLALDPERLEVVQIKETSPGMSNVVRLKIIGQKQTRKTDNSNEIDPFEDPFETPATN